MSIHTEIVPSDHTNSHQQEPFGWVNMPELTNHFERVSCGTIYKNPGEGRTPLYAAPVHASDISQERVDETAKREHEVEFREYLTRLNWQQGFERGWDDAVEKLTLTQEKLGYTAPPKREWVGLADEERKLVIHEWRHQEGKAAQLCQAIEAKLKEKNSG